MKNEGLTIMAKNEERRAPTLSKTEYVILYLLVKKGRDPMYGLEMVADSDGKLKRGTVYVLLGRLEDKGFVKTQNEVAAGAANPRRLYRITAVGRKVFDAWSQVANLGNLRGAFAM